MDTGMKDAAEPQRSPATAVMVMEQAEGISAQMKDLRDRLRGLGDFVQQIQKPPCSGEKEKACEVQPIFETTYRSGSRTLELIGMAHGEVSRIEAEVGKSS